MTYQESLSAHKAKHGDMRLGGGGRFSALKNKLSHRHGVTNPAALAAYIGREKYGASKMAHMAAAGKK